MKKRISLTTLLVCCLFLAACNTLKTKKEATTVQETTTVQDSTTVAGKKRMKAIGSVEVPQEAFLSVLSMDEE